MNELMCPCGGTLIMKTHWDDYDKHFLVICSKCHRQGANSNTESHAFFLFHEEYPLSPTIKNAEIELFNRVYEATKLIEDLENSGLYLGNGHHARQRIGNFAVELLQANWKESFNEDD